MKYLTIFIIFLFQCLPALAGQQQFMGQTARKNASSDPYQQIIAYHNCDALGDLVKATGSATVTYGASVALDEVAPIVGTGSWGNANTAWQTVSIPISGNVDFDSGSIGFYVHLNELNSGGGIVSSNGGDFLFELYASSYTRFNLTYKGSNINTLVHGMASGGRYFISLVFNGGDCTVYVNGASVGGITGAGGAIDDTDLNFWQYGTSTVCDMTVDQFISSDEATDVYSLRDITTF